MESLASNFLLYGLEQGSMDYVLANNVQFQSGLIDERENVLTMKTNRHAPFANAAESRTSCPFAPPTYNSKWSYSVFSSNLWVPLRPLDPPMG